MTREATIKIYDALIEQCPNVIRKGKTMPYTSANGYMFSQVNKAGELGIRLQKDMGNVFMETHNTTIFKSYGAVMKDYVLIPEHLLSDTTLLVDLLETSFAYVMTLPKK